ncbi:Protein NUCLEOLAR COMPLEX ASSOCIATED 4 [Linum grandiflorum]
MPTPANKKHKSKTKSKPKNSSLKELRALGQQLLSSRSHVNNLPLLLDFISPESPPQFVLESLLSLQSFFTPLLPQLPSSSTSKTPHSKDHCDDDNAEIIYLTWLRSKFDLLVTSLIDIIISPHPDPTLKEVVLDAIMDFVKVGNRGTFHSAIYHRLIHNIVYSTTPVDFIVDFLVSKFFKYSDVRYFTYISLDKLARTLETKGTRERKTESSGGDIENQSNLTESAELPIYKMHYILSHVPSINDEKENSTSELWSDSGIPLKGETEIPKSSKIEDKQLKSSKQTNDTSTATVVKKMKFKFTKAWISFLKLALPLDVYKEVLATMHQAVMPNMTNPLMLCDFLTRSYDIGGVVSVMALSSLFILMTKHGLEYPDFYEKLYALLVPSIFMAKHRAKFFELLDSCLRSPLLPAYLAAAFTKRLSRLSIVVPPSGGLVIIALIHNLLRRHPSISCLVHREEVNGDDDEGNGTTKRVGIDLFDNNESNPMKSNALRSSLWEVENLRHHYCPPVSRCLFVESLEADLTVTSKTTEMNIKDFSSGSYATIFGAEIRRRVKQVPLAFYKVTPTTLFSESDYCGWTFKCEEGSKQGDESNAGSSPAKRQRTN